MQATGQFGAEPTVKIWSASCVDQDPPVADGPEGRPEPITLKFDRGEQAIIGLAFSVHDDGRRLATISTNNEHTVSLWDWRTQKRLATGNGYSGQPPQVFGVVWNPYKDQEEASPFDFVTFGTKHVSFWTYDEAENLLTSKGCSFGTTTQQNIRHAVFLPTGQLLTGGDNGCITVWVGNKGVAETKNRHSGKLNVRRLKYDHETLLT
eukprot:SAG31_NODE_15462_length_754_cov_0.838168_1_plen_206_part_10